MSSLGRSPPLIRFPPPGPRSRELSARLAAVECPAFDARRETRAAASGAEQAPIVYSHGEGANLVDVDENRFVDLTCGFGALPFGHCDPRVGRAALGQMQRLPLALGDVYASEPKVLLCERLARLFGQPGAKVMLGLSGADALTAALKTARLATGRPGIVAFEGAYHGLSHGPLAACGFTEAFRAPFLDQLNAHVTFARYPARSADLDASLSDVMHALARGDVGAVVVEPILGRGGVIVPPPAFLPELRRLSRDAGALLVADEVWTGLRRAGAWFLSASAEPDLVCIGKALGGGLPVSACIGNEQAMAAWEAHGGAAIHTATHFGWPAACASALAVLDALEALTPPADDWAATVARATQGLGVRAVRGRGRMLGVELEGGAARALGVTRALLRRGFIVLTGGVRGDVLTLTPPLDVDRDLLTLFEEALASTLEEVAG